MEAGFSANEARFSAATIVTSSGKSPFVVVAIMPRVAKSFVECHNIRCVSCRSISNTH